MQPQNPLASGTRQQAGAHAEADNDLQRLHLARNAEKWHRAAWQGTMKTRTHAARRPD